MRSFINATNITQSLSSARRDAHELLPLLVDKLITASVPLKKIKQKRIPHGDQIGLTGPDGILVIETGAETQYVPAGISIWEFGTSKDPKTKAKDDFNRAEEKLAAAFPTIRGTTTPDKATFVFVTPQSWQGASVWKKEKCGESNWKDIRVYDAVDLEKWLEQCFAVMLWFAEVCGLPAEGFFDAEQYLKKQSIQFDTPLSAELVIAGRTKETADVLNCLTNGCQSFCVCGESTEEGAAFIAATVLSNKERLSDVPPVVFANGKANLKLLATFKDPLTIVPIDLEALSKAREASQSEWRIVTLDIVKKELNVKGSILLSKCKRKEVEKYLIETMHLSEHRARQIARDSKGSLAALLWMIGSGPLALPRWLTCKDATTHASIMLAGSWIGNNSDDSQIIERLARKEYREIETLLQAALLPEGPWLHQGLVWLCASKDFVWSQLAHKLTETMLQDFQNVVADVVGEIDPALELKPTERYMASFLGKIRKHSNYLRKGLVDSLARLAIVRADGQGLADKIVQNLLNPIESNADDNWLSLVDVYSELAEAAPTIFLDCLDKVLNQNPNLFYSDDAEESYVFGSTSPHVYLLWALERLAWQHESFPRVIAILAKLAKSSPETTSGNNPINSLVTIMLPRKPQHSEDMSDAAQALEILQRVSPDIAWKVGIKLLPAAHSVSSLNPKPEYRGEVNKLEITRKDYWNFVRTVVEKMVQWADSNPNRLADLIHRYPELQRGWNEVGDMVITVLNDINCDAWDDKDKAIIKNTLDELICRHMEHQDTDWALPKQDLETLGRICGKFVPSDIVLQVQQYFTWDPNDPQGPTERYGDEWDKWLEEKRAQAALTVYENQGLEGLYRLAKLSLLPACVGVAIASLRLRESDIIKLVKDTLSIEPDLYHVNNLLLLGRGFVFTCYRKEQCNWLRLMLALPIEWSPTMYANLSLSIPETPETWAQVEKWGVETKKLYWRNVEIGPRSVNEWERIIDEWKNCNRPYSAIRFLGYVVELQHKSKITIMPSAEDIMEVLELALKGGDDTEPSEQRRAMISYYAEKLFLYLDSQECDTDRLARLEWGYLRLLEDSKRGIKVLKQQITSSAEMFVSVLKLVYEAEKESSVEGTDKANEALISQGFRLLHGINSIPGLRKTADGVVVDAIELHRWIVESRKLADDAGLLGICDGLIGEILSYSPESPDGTWPCVEVRGVIEEMQSESIEDGIQIGKYNQRGAVYRGKGGQQEWILAQEYRTYAEKVRIQWPRSAHMLQAIAETYEREAEDWDKREAWNEYA